MEKGAGDLAPSTATALRVVSGDPKNSFNIQLLTPPFENEDKLYFSFLFKANYNYSAGLGVFSLAIKGIHLENRL